MSLFPASPKIKRLGFHYYFDTQHYTAADCEQWSSELKQLGASWLVLTAPLERAIPEEFLRTLLKTGIQPILHFNPRIEARLDKNMLRFLLEQYARWGMRHVIFFDRPNLRQSWSPSTWSQADLVDRFLDKFIPCAEMAVEFSMIPTLSALEPGGDYWDLAFLRSAFTSILRRGNSDLLESLALGAYSRLINRPVDWGAGGPQRWPAARPYRTEPGVQDQRGYHIYEWYLAAATEVLGLQLPILMLEAGFYLGEEAQPAGGNESIVAVNTLSLLKHLSGENETGFASNLPEHIIACCFPLVPSPGNEIVSGLSWYQSDSSPRPVVDAARRWASSLQSSAVPESTAKAMPVEDTFKLSSTEAIQETGSFSDSSHPGEETPFISHYILLPLYAWGAADWDFELISPLLRDSHPTVGFSLNEASRAERVTVVGGPGVFTDEALALLRNAGCAIDRLTENGTIIAS